MCNYDREKQEYFVYTVNTIQSTPGKQNINRIQWTLTPCIYIQGIPAFTPTVYSVLYTGCGPVPQAHSGDAGWADKHVDSLLLHCLPFASPYQFKNTL